jgi:hypothetical protein
MPSDTRENQVLMALSQIDGWMSELEVLGRDPSVMKFNQLRQKIDDADAFIDNATAPPMSNPWSLFEPYDTYDAFEFAHDLTGREVSTRQLSKLAHARFPDLSFENRGLLMRYLIGNGVAEVARTTATGSPVGYRFGSLGNGGTVRTRKRLGIPDNELSGLKAEELEDVVVPTRTADLQ